MVNVDEKQIEEKFEKIYKEESETKSRRDIHNAQKWFYTWKTCVRRVTSSIFNVADVCKTWNKVSRTCRRI